MVDDPREPEEVRLREHAVPGPARMFGLTLADGTTVEVFVESPTSGAQVGIIPPGADSAALNLQFSKAEATTFASLISGVHYVVDATGHDTGGGADENTAAG